MGSLIDREKVIKGLECCIPSRDKEERDKERECRHQDCPYEHFMKGNYGCFWELLTDALVLLKEKDAVEPRRDANCVRMFRCGVCGEYVGFIDSDPGDPNEQDNYCRNCGRRQKWA